MDRTAGGFSSVLLGGAATPRASLEPPGRGVPVVTTYGMTETAAAALRRVPLDGVRAEVRDDGRIWISGPVLFSGYLAAPRAADGWFRTGDLLT
jgi:O-succinylbenzoic acid--CoA ligase